MYPSAYIQYLAHFHGDRDYFECHEILEEFWKQTDGGNKNSIWVGFILLAVSCYHHRRNNFSGAKKTLQKAQFIFAKEQQTLSKLGLNPISFIALVNELLSKMEQGKIYQDVNLPFEASELIQRCKLLCSEWGVIWCSSSNMENGGLIDRHKTRDRTEVIQERLYALKNKKNSE